MASTSMVMAKRFLHGSAVTSMVEMATVFRLLPLSKDFVAIVMRMP
jgi:hypothetical protein